MEDKETIKEFSNIELYDEGLIIIEEMRRRGLSEEEIKDKLSLKNSIDIIYNFILWFWSDDEERKRPLKALEGYKEVLEDE